MRHHLMLALANPPATPGKQPVDPSSRSLLRRLWRRLCALPGEDLRDESGSALVELAVVVAAFGLPLIVGTTQMGTLVYDSIEVSNAAHAGAAYGMQNLTTASNTSGITTAAQNEATDFAATLTVTPISYYACANAEGGTQYTGANAQTNATAACTGTGNHALEFIQVNTSVAVTSAIRWSFLPASYTLRGVSVMEVEQ